MKVSQVKKAAMLAEVTKIKKAIDSGKIRGPVALKTARNRIKNLRWLSSDAYQKAKETRKQKPRTRTARAQKKVDLNQGILPHFLAQMDTVKLEELIVQRIFQRVEKSVTQKINELIEGVG